MASKLIRLFSQIKAEADRTLNHDLSAFPLEFPYRRYAGAWLLVACVVSESEISPGALQKSPPGDPVGSTEWARRIPA